MTDIEAARLRSRLDRLLGERSAAKQRKEDAEARVEQHKARRFALESVRKLIQKLAEEMQGEVEVHINGIVTAALHAVFGERYEFVLRFSPARGKTEALLLLREAESGEEIDPLEATGGGVADLVSYALRVAMWSLRRPRRRAVMALDEPFRNLHGSLQERAGEMVRMLADKLKLQHIVITNQEALAKGGSAREFRISKGILSS